MEIFENDLLYCTGTPAEIHQLTTDLGLGITSLQPFRDSEGASRAQLAANMARTRRKFALMYELGCGVLLLCSNMQLDCSADNELQIAGLRVLVTLVEEKGIIIGYEVLAWGTHVNRWQQAWEWVRRANSLALDLVLDSFHILTRGDTLSTLPSVPVEEITFVQLVGAPYTKMDLPEWSRRFRCLPGQGELPPGPFVEQVTRCGYRGPWSLEISNDGFRTSSNDTTAKDGYRSLLWLEEQAHHRLPTCDADLLSPLPLSIYHGLGLIEFIASTAEAQRLGQHLQVLGFQYEGSHRSRQVTLWRNGRARTVTNHQPHNWAGHSYQRHGVLLCAMTLRVDRGAPIVAHARALRYAIWQDDARPNETLISAIHAPDGSLTYLIETGEGIYECDFHLHDELTVHEDYLGIDHLALGMEADSRDNWVMFLHTVFGFTLEHGQTLLGPYGLVRSLTVCSPQGDIRLALSISQGRATQIVYSVVCYQRVGLQRAAFACHDLPVTCDQLTDVTRRALSTPANYYSGLPAHLGGELDAGQLQRRQLLYDHDPWDGAFLHLCTRPSITGCFFSELTERRVGYTFCGAMNAAICPAAMQYCQPESNGSSCLKHDNNILCTRGRN